MAPDYVDTCPTIPDVQDIFDDTGIYPNMFFHPQYAALNVWSSVAYSDYHAFTLTARERFKNDLVMDFNYTWSRSMDNASGLQAEGSWSSSAFIVNPLYPDASYSASDFDANHVINANWLWFLPVGKGKHFGSGMNPVLSNVLGNWRLNGIFRWNSGLPVVYAPFTSGVWPTNWNLMTPGYRLRDPKPARPRTRSLMPTATDAPRTCSPTPTTPTRATGTRTPASRVTGTSCATPDTWHSISA